MKINILELKKKSEVTFKGKQQVSLKGISPVHKVQVCDADVEGTLQKVDGRYIVEGQVSVIVKRLCDRCSEEFDCFVEGELFQEYSSEPIGEDQEDIIQISDTIDLEDAVAETIYLNLPMHWVHDENCKGICKICGQNLNKHSCNCAQEEIDPRLEGLKNIFHPQSEE